MERTDSPDGAVGGENAGITLKSDRPQATLLGVDAPHRRPTSSSPPWSPSSWRDLPAGQQPEWPDEGALERALKRISTLPPLVFAGEARSLTAALGDVADGRAFLLQAGDCAESFDGFSADSIRDKLRVILQMAVVLTYGTGCRW